MPFHEPWPHERVERLTTLWSSTLGASEIAERLTMEFYAARPISADAVQKKAKHLGLPVRCRTETVTHKVVRRAGYESGGFAGLHGGNPRAPTIFAEDVFPVETRKTLIELDHGQCKWPGDSGFFCGLPAEIAGADTYRPYCSDHCARAFLGRRQLTDNEARTVARLAA